MSAKPGAADTGWLDLGDLKNVEIEKIQVKRDIYGSSPGRKRRKRQIVTREDLDITFTCQDWSDLMVQLTFGTGHLEPGDTQFSPLSGDPVEGWLKGAVYDHRDDQLVVVDFWVTLTIEGRVSLESDDASTSEFTVKAAVNHSSLNAGWKRAS